MLRKNARTTGPYSVARKPIRHACDFKINLNPRTHQPMTIGTQIIQICVRNKEQKTSHEKEEILSEMETYCILRGVPVFSSLNPLSKRCDRCLYLRIPLERVDRAFTALKEKGRITGTHVYKISEGMPPDVLEQEEEYYAQKDQKETS